MRRTSALLRVSGWALVLGLSLAVAGCMDEQPTVDRVQPNALDKSMFEGEFYFLQTVIDTPYSAGYTFVGEQGGLEKIVWEIQEDYLIARRSYEHIAGSEAEGIAGATEHGAPVAMYKITSHFDIRREYNTVTGEEMNVVSENTVDRPWHERDFMRVDWSENLITSSDFLVLARVFDGVETEPVSYYVQNLAEDHPHRPKFVTREGSDEVEYIDIVNKMFVRPTTVDIEGYGPIPSCFLLYQDHLDCAPGEITVRNSFLKVDEASHDYQPQLYTGDRMERFGYFVTERAGYDRDYGVTEPARYRFANRHNIWAESHKKDANGNLLRCTEYTAADVCGDDGSTCDLHVARAERRTAEWGELEGACTIPYRDRTIRPIAYHVSPNFPAELWVDAEHLVQEWNTAFTETVGSLRTIECTQLGGDEASCAAEREREDAAHTFVLCHNPVVDGDAEACGPAGTSAQIGDLRRHLIGWVGEPHSSSPLGYGPSAADPETGEIIMGNAFIYGAAMETLGAWARDIIAVLNDDLDATQITSGENIAAWVERQTLPGSEVTGRPADDHVIPIDGYNVDRVNDAMDFSWARNLGAAARGASSHRPGNVRELLERFDSSLATLRRNGAFGQDEALGTARLRNLHGTEIEELLTNSEMRVAAGIDPSLPVNDGILEAASPLRGMNPRYIAALARARDRIQAESCILNADFADEGLLGLAREIKRQAENGDGTMEWYGAVYTIIREDGSLDYDAVRQMLRHPIFDAVTAHEVGHTLGLRHNFSGSYDSLNYNPRYWELRNDGNMAPRAWDPITQAEIDGRIREAQYSTVMDYGNNFVVTDSMGIGHYDHAAIKMGYGDLVEVFDNAADPDAVAWINFIQGAGWPVPLKLEAFTGAGEVTAYNYTEIPQVIGGVEAIQQRADVPYGSLVANPFLSSQGIDDRTQDELGRPTVPYMFCSDEQADLNPDCQRYDAGADAYESLQSVIDTYWNYYIFNAFRRGRIGFNTGSYANRIGSRYFAKLQSANQIYSLYRGVFEDIFGGDPSYERFWTRPDGMGAWTAAVGSSFELFTRVIATPEPGTYSTAMRSDGTEAMLPATGQFAEAEVEVGDGRSIETTWDFDAGYFWFDQMDRAGFFYDKAIALIMLMDPETHFLGRDTSADIRKYQINYYSSFGPALTSLIRGVLGEDWRTISPRYVSSQEGLSFPDPLELEQGSMAGVPLDPNTSFSIQLYAAVYGMAMLPDTYDQGFINRSRIFVKGAAEGLDVGIKTIEFTDPASGLTYVSASYEDDAGRETGVGAQMLLHAQEMLDRGETAELERFVDNINIMRRLTYLFGFGTL